MEQQKIFTPLREGEGNQSTMAEETPKRKADAFAAKANKKRLSKQLSLRETTREAKWERRRRQVLLQRKRMMEGVLEEDEEEEEGNGSTARGRAVRSLTDEDLDELRGFIELGFGFSEENGHKLCDTLPALDLYFAVNRQFSDPKLRASPSPASSPKTAATPSSPCSSPGSAKSLGSQHSAGSSDSWKILSPGDNPETVKTRLRHWAQVVACSVRQCC